MKRWFAVPMISALALATVGAGLAAPSLAANAIPFSSAVFNAYSTGTVVHADAATAAPTQLLSAEEAFSGASVASKGTGTLPGQGPTGTAAGTIVNEVKQVVQPKLPIANAPKATGNKSFARGAGLEVNLGQTLPGTNPATIPINTVQVSSPPKADDVKEVGPVPADPLAYATLLRGEGHSDWNDDTCILGKPISQGIGFAADAQLVNTGTSPLPGGAPLVAADAPTPERRVAQSLSQTVFVPQTDKDNKVVGTNFGLASETRQTIAPVTLFKGTPNAVTIEVLGEWVLQAIAGGLPGTARIVYAPAGSPTPTTPLVRIVQTTVTTILKTQDLFGPAALPIPLIDIPGLAQIAIGESPRAIGGNNSTKATEAPDGTTASGAVDVVRVTLADSALADIRIGHMEAKTTVPAGGFTCPIPVTKDSNPRVVTAGQKFTYTITINNKFDCKLDPVKVVDTITLTPGIKYSIIGTSIPTSSTGTNLLTWDNVGPMPPHTTKSISIEVQVAKDSAAGLFTNTADVTAKCSGAGAGGTGIDQAKIVGLAEIKVPVDVVGQVIVQLPRVTGGELAATGQPHWVLPAGVAMILAGMGLAVGSFRLRRSTP